MKLDIQKTFPNAVEGGQSCLSASCNMHCGNEGSVESISGRFLPPILDSIETQIGMEDFRDE